MRTEAVVLITGSCLYVPLEQKYVWGDLWECGDVYIFNACLNDDVDSNWSYGTYNGINTEKSLIVSGCSYFERRGVIVIAKSDAVLNETAKRYLEGLPS